MTSTNVQDSELCNNNVNYSCRTLHFKCFQGSLEISKGFLRNFAKFTGKRLCQSFFFNKVAGLKLPLIKSFDMTEELMV